MQCSMNRRRFLKILGAIPFLGIFLKTEAKAKTRRATADELRLDELRRLEIMAAHNIWKRI